ncbi:MAG: methyltransferase domain-containing protein [Balneolaceae bacterium]|jgi:ubiquinone/menaquinone biosynthesis C-methylase UbiE
MTLHDKRAHGVTPGLNRNYVDRTADKQAAFVMPYLRPRMNLLDIGCGPGTITLGLAQAVAPGHVTGIDHDEEHIKTAKTLAEYRGVTNVTFRNGDALSLPFENDTFDAAYENNVFTHLADGAARAAVESYRVLKPGGILAARDVEAESVVWGNSNDSIKQLDKLMIAWHRNRGSDITLGKQLPAILRKAGFINLIKSVSADTKGTPEAVQNHAKITMELLNGPFGRDIVNNGWADRATVEQLKKAIRKWGEHPDAFFGNIHVEVIGWKSE